MFVNCNCLPFRLIFGVVACGNTFLSDDDTKWDAWDNSFVLDDVLCNDLLDELETIWLGNVINGFDFIRALCLNVGLNDLDRDENVVGFVGVDDASFLS